MEKDVQVKKVNMGNGLIELKVSKKYIERLRQMLNVQFVGESALSNFISSQLELKDRVDYGYLDYSILPPRSIYPLNVISRNKRDQRGIRNADFVLFMELMISNRIGHIRNLGPITRGRLIDAYIIAFYPNVIYKDLIDMATDHLKTEKLPNMIQSHQIIGVLDDFKNKYKII